MSKGMVRCYYIDETINPFSIGYMINPSLNCSKVLRVQVENILSVLFHSRIMETIRYCLKKKNTFVIALKLIYDNNGVKPKLIVYSVKLCSLFSHGQLYLY